MSLILSLSCPAAVVTFEVTSLTEEVMDVALDKKDDTPEVAVVDEGAVLVGDVGADVTLVLLVPVAEEPVVEEATPLLEGSVDGGTAEVGLPGKVGPPPVTLGDEGPAAPVKSSSPSCSPERSP